MNRQEDTTIDKEVAHLAYRIGAARCAEPDPRTPPILSVSRDGDLPLSFAQQRLWFLDQLESGNPGFNIPAAVRLTGPLNVTALEQSLNEIMRRHEVLRTTFPAVEGQPVQVIAPVLTLTLPVVDLRELPLADRETEARWLATEEAQRPFDLARGSLLRATLLRLAEEDHVLLLMMHHIVSDGWSMEVLFQELSALYEAFSTGRCSPLPELPIQYADFAHWQRGWLQGEFLEKQLSYWKQRLSDTPVLGLPTDRPRPARQTYKGATQSLMLPSFLCESLKALSRQEGVTLFMTLLAAFQTLLYRYTDQDDILVGSPMAGRNRVELEGLIGFFVNTLVLRTDLSGDPTFRELLGRVREVALGAYTHQDLPFEKLVEELQPERSLSHTPLSQVMFTLQNAPRPALALSGLTLSALQVGRETAKFDLTLDINEGPEGLTATLQYNTDLFDATTIARMGGHFQRLLEGIVADPGQSISTLPLLTEAEQHQLLVEWNEDQFEDQAEDPQDELVHQLFEAQVERTPDAVALVFDGDSLTYRELNSRANQLAHHLRALWVGPDVLVGICMERSLELVVAILGVLKAGGACVPLDPAYPKERLAYMLEDTRVPVLLTQKRLLKELPKREVHIVCLDAGCESFARESTEPPASGVTSENLAFVFYTSGSTGRPKAVMWSHGKRNSRQSEAQATYQLTEEDRHLLKSSIGFTPLSMEVFWPLLTGARMIIARPGWDQDTAYLVKLIAEHRITIINFVPSMLRVFLQEQELEGCECLRHVVCLGESLSTELQERFFARLSADLSVFYGATEAPSATFWKCQREDDRRIVGIGRRLANKQIYLLDRHLQPVPIRVPGELYIGGRLARGYLNRPELTAEKFIPNPFSDEPGARLYKTGDLARYLPDGNIEYLGRLDHQVKIRGFRIEPGEIEAVLGQHPAVLEAVVTAREDVPGEKRLVAYVVPYQGPLPSHSELRNFLKEKLPVYMVPSMFVLLDALPLTPNGKVDRRALPAPDQARPVLEEAFAAPRTPIEEALAGIWCEVLKLEQVGIHDNFFELGGHSLLAVRLFSQIEKTFSKKLPLTTLFQAPTIEQLADILRQQDLSASWSSLIPIQSGGSKPPFFCIHAGGGTVLFYRDLSRRLGEDQPFYGLQAQGINEQQKPHTSMEEMAAHYLSEIRTLQPEGPYYLGGACFGGTVAFEMAQQLHATGQEVALLVMFDTYAPGYFRFLMSNRSITSFRYKVSFLKQRVQHHLGSLLMLEPRDKLTYIGRKGEKAWRKIKKRIKNGSETVARKLNSAIVDLSPRAPQKTEQAFQLAGEGNLPDVYYPRLVTLSEAFSLAHRNYVPRVYPGRLTLFKARISFPGVNPERDLGWGRHVAGGIEIHEIAGFHGAQVVEPRVRYLAPTLKKCLERAQSMESESRINPKAMEQSSRRHYQPLTT